MARKALVAVILAGIVAGIWQWSRPKVCHGNGEILYTDRDGTYQLLLGATTDRFQPVYEYTVDFEVDQDGRMPSRLYINHVVTGANAKEVFLQKVIRVTAELIQPEGKESPWHCTEPSQQDFAPEAALVSFLDFTGRSGEAELRWTLEMENGDTLYLHQNLKVEPIYARHFYPEDVPMDTTEALQALVDQLSDTVPEEEIIYLHLPPITYQGGLSITKRAVNLCGAEGDTPTVFTGSVQVKVQTDVKPICYFDHINFTGPGSGVGVSASTRVHLTDCRLSGWRTGLLGYGYTWVNAKGCVFADNTTGVHFNATGGTISDTRFWDNLFQNNGTAVLLEEVPGDESIKFDGSRFTGNGIDIDNRCGQAVKIDEVIFE
ncbi:MAG: hypothetical protein HFE97_04000 [Oscillospiraceae bacterium]|nr:hypothetical protein [Oscillospiraceae bacterium]